MATGAKASVMFGFETNFGTAAACTKTFGRGVSISELSEENNLERVYGIGSKSPQAIDVGQYGISFGVEFNVASPDFLQCLFGAPVSGVWTNEGTPNSTTVQISKPISGSSAEISKYTGCICTDCSLDLTNERAVKASMSFLAANVSTAESSIPAQVMDTEDIYTYAECNYYLGDQKLAAVQNANITLTQNAELVYGLGNRFGVGEEYLQQEISVTCVNRYDNPALFRQKMMGGSSVPSQTGPTSIPLIKIGLESLKDGSDIIFEFSDCLINSYSSPASNAEIITEEVEIMPLGLKITTKESAA